MPSGWRTDFAWRTFRAADQAQPQAAWRKCGSDLCRELLPLLWFIEHVKATAVEHELERPIGRRRGEKVPCSKAAAQIASSHFSPGFFDSERRDIDSEHFETVLRHPNRIGAGTRPDLKRRTWPDPARSDELDEHRFWLAGVPGQLSRGVALIP